MTIITPWVISGEVNTDTVIVNNVIVGAVLVVLGATGFLASLRRLRR